MRYVGVDLSENAIEMARGIGLTAHRVDGEDLPFDSGTFDVAIAFEVFEHLFNPHHAAGELLRVLKPGGVLLGTVPNVAFWRRRFELAIHGVWNPYGDFLSVREPWRDPHIRFFNAVQLRRMLEKAGFSNIIVDGHEGRLMPILERLRLKRRLFSLLAVRLNVIARKPSGAAR